MLSKRQAGVDPDCNPTKKYKLGGEQTKSPFILDPDFSSDDDSFDDDFELVARPKKVTSTTKEKTSQTVEEVYPDLDISLASYLLDLKQGKVKSTTTEEVVGQGEEIPDEEMAEEFALNKSHGSSGGQTFHVLPPLSSMKHRPILNQIHLNLLIFLLLLKAVLLPVLSTRMTTPMTTLWT